MSASTLGIRTLLIPLSILGASGGLSARFQSQSQSLAADSVGSANSADWLDVLKKQLYPRHYVAQKLRADQRISIDGLLDEAAWQEVPFTGNFSDIVQNKWTANMIEGLPSHNWTQMKVRWDSDFVYVGAELQEYMPRGTIRGHNGGLTDRKAPYQDNDFEVFFAPSMNQYWYKEFEMNYLNATYDVFWRVPDGSVPCAANATTGEWCQNSTFNEGQSWTMSPALRTRTARTGYGWSVEAAFPLRAGRLGGRAHGGLLDADRGFDGAEYDPNRGRQYWYIAFSRTQHASGIYEDPPKPYPGKDACAAWKKQSPNVLGVNPWDCYLEECWQPINITYMHHPDAFGFLQFAPPGEATMIENKEWPVRFFLGQIWRMQKRRAMLRKNYVEALQDFAPQETCRGEDGCVVDAMERFLRHLREDRDPKFSLALAVNSSATNCVDYFGNHATGGSCFIVELNQTLPSGRVVRGTIQENRFTDITIL